MPQKIYGKNYIQCLIMKRFVSIIMSFAVIIGSVQNINAVDTGFVKVSAYVDSNENISIKEKEILIDKIQILITRGGIGLFENERFVISASVTEVSHNVMYSATLNTYVCELRVSFFFKDCINGILFSSNSLDIKGMGLSLEDARIDALKSINFRDPSFKHFIEKGKERIINYDESNYD